MWEEKIWRWVSGQHVAETMYENPDYLKWSVYIKMLMQHVITSTVDVRSHSLSPNRNWLIVEK